jgi:hypothetical protein
MGPAPKDRNCTVPQPKSFQQVFSELWDLLKSYAQQETVGPLKNLGNQFKWGMAGSFCVTLGIFLLTMAVLRGVQTQVAFVSGGPGWTFVPYLIAFLVLLAFMAWVGFRMKRAFDTVNPDRASGSDPVGDSDL